MPMRVIRGIMPAYAGVVELADARDSKSRVRKDVRVRPPPPAPKSRSAIGAARFCIVQQGSNPKALGKAPGALCNLRRPAPQRRSTPATGTTSSQASYRLRRFFMLSIKNHLALTALLLLSNLNPLRCASSWFYAMRQANIANMHIRLVKLAVFW